MRLTNDDIKRGLAMCQSAPDRIALATGLGGQTPSEAFYEYARTLLPVALAELQRWRPVIEAALVVARRIEPTGDWACAKCRPYSDMLVEGFRCGPHALLEAINAASEPKPTR